MMLNNGDGTHTGGPYDVIMILHNVKTNRFHVAFYEEALFPGGVDAETNQGIVRLKSKMHHTAGADTLEEAMIHLEDLRKKLHLPDQNVWKEPREWNGELGLIEIVPRSEFAVK